MFVLYDRCVFYSWYIMSCIVCLITETSPKRYVIREVLDRDGLVPVSFDLQGMM